MVHSLIHFMLELLHLGVLLRALDSTMMVGAFLQVQMLPLVSNKVSRLTLLQGHLHKTILSAIQRSSHQDQVKQGTQVDQPMRSLVIMGQLR